MTSQTKSRSHRPLMVAAIVGTLATLGGLLMDGGREPETVHALGRSPAATVSADVPQSVAQATVATPVPSTQATSPSEAPPEHVRLPRAAAVTPRGASAGVDSPPIPALPTTVALHEAPAPAALEELGEDTSPGRYQETPDAGNYIILPAGSGEGLASSQGNGPERLRFSVYVVDSDPADAAGLVSVELTNTSGRDMRFMDGVIVLAQVTRDGKPWREFVLSDPGIILLAPGQGASLRIPFDFEGPGQYSSWGSVEVELV